MAVGENVGFDRDRSADDALGRKRTTAHLRRHALDDGGRTQTRCVRCPPVRPLALAHGADAAHTRHADFARRQAVGQWLTGDCAGGAEQRPGGRIERIEAYRDRLRRSEIIVNQSDDAALRGAAIGGVEPRQNGHVGRGARQPTHFPCRPDGRQAFGLLGHFLDLRLEVRLKPRRHHKSPGRGRGQPEGASPQADVRRRDPQRRLGQADHRRDAAERVVLLDIPVRPPVPPRRRGKNAIETGAYQVGMARPIHAGGPAPETTGPLSANRADNLPQGLARQNIEAHDPEP